MAIDRQELIEATERRASSSPPTGLLARAAGLPGGQRPRHGAGPRGRRGADRGVRGRDRPAGDVQLGQTPTRTNDESRRAAARVVERDRRRRSGARRAAGPVHHPGPLRRPAVPGVRWRQHAGVGVDQQYFWWHSAGSHPDGELSLNFGRINDPVDRRGAGRGPLGQQRRKRPPRRPRRSTGSSPRTAIYIPLSWTLWGIISEPACRASARS